MRSAANVRADTKKRRSRPPEYPLGSAVAIYFGVPSSITVDLFNIASVFSSECSRYNSIAAFLDKSIWSMVHPFLSAICLLVQLIVALSNPCLHSPRPTCGIDDLLRTRRDEACPSKPRFQLLRGQRRGGHRSQPSRQHLLEGTTR